MKNIRNVFFDLDGTLTDPAEGIIECIQYALKNLNLSCPSQSELASYIGPPLRESFSVICNSSDSLLIERAVALFRKRFSTVGLFENQVYPGVEQMLSDLHSMSYKLFVATSKPEIYAEKILRHFSLSNYFVEVGGNDLDGRLDNKAVMIKELLKRHSLSPDQTIMVGDRKHDVIAAKKNGVLSLGITYGYGSEEELTKAGADYFCHDPSEIVLQMETICSQSSLQRVNH